MLFSKEFFLNALRAILIRRAWFFFHFAYRECAFSIACDITFIGFENVEHALEEKKNEFNCLSGAKIAKMVSTFRCATKTVPSPFSRCNSIRSAMACLFQFHHYHNHFCDINFLSNANLSPTRDTLTLPFVIETHDVKRSHKKSAFCFKRLKTQWKSTHFPLFSNKKSKISRPRRIEHMWIEKKSAFQTKFCVNIEMSTDFMVHKLSADIHSWAASSFAVSSFCTHLSAAVELKSSASLS